MKYYLIFTDRYPDGKVVTSAQIMDIKLAEYDPVVEVEDKYTAKLVRGIDNEELPEISFHEGVDKHETL